MRSGAVVLLATAVIGACGQQHAFSLSETDREQQKAYGVKAKLAITPELSAFIEDIMQIDDIPGISLGIVHTTDLKATDVELRAWGKKTEDGGGHDLAPDVSVQPQLACEL